MDILLRQSGLLLAVLIGIVSASSISLRTDVVRTENEKFQVFVACSGNAFDFGAGIVITSTHILTSASLVRGFVSWNVGYGSNTLMSLNYMESTIAFMHPNFNTQTGNNNLGIIVLPKRLPSDIVHPVTLPSAIDGVFPLPNQEGRIVGFGLVDETMVSKPAPTAFLKTVYLTVRPSTECADRYTGLDANRNFCSSDLHVNSMNVCKGDVGNAFIVTLRGQKILAGMGAFVSDACKATELTSFVRIQSYLPWINAVTGM